MEPQQKLPKTNKQNPTSATKHLQVTTTIRNEFMKPRMALLKNADEGEK